MKIYIGADHAGFDLKQDLIKHLTEQEINGQPEFDIEDVGATKVDPDDDYPDIVEKFVKKIHRGKNNMGILICGNAIGVCMAANKYKGIRAGVGYNTYAARTSRTDDNTNVLCLAGRVLSTEYGRAIARIWLETPFSNEPRHKRRLDKIVAHEEATMKE